MIKKKVDLDKIISTVNQLIDDREKAMTTEERQNRMLVIYQTGSDLVRVWKDYSQRRFSAEEAVQVQKVFAEFPTYLSGLNWLAEETLSKMDREGT